MIYNYCCRSIIVQILIIVVFSIFLSGCGKKAPPNPPRQEKPPIVDDLSHSLDGNKLQLTWTIPEVKEKVKSGLCGFYVFRFKKSVSEPDCKNCPKIFKRVVDIFPEDMGNSGKDRIIKYAEALEKGYRYIYKVVIYTNNGVMGKDSNMVDFTY
jgi:predicted small lipoprotein YifL